MPFKFASRGVAGGAVRCGEAHSNAKAGVIRLRLDKGYVT